MYTPPYHNYVQTLRDTGKYRKLPLLRQEKIFDELDFSNNDYLGLSQHPQIIEAAVRLCHRRKSIKTLGELSSSL